MRRPGLLLPLVVVVLWVLLFFLLDYLAARTEGPRWIPAGSEWRVNVSVPASWEQRPVCSVTACSWSACDVGRGRERNHDGGTHRHLSAGLSGWPDLGPLPGRGHGLDRPAAAGALVVAERGSGCPLRRLVM